MMQQTSMDAYRTIKGKLNHKEQVVFDQVQVSGGCTNEKLSDLLGWSINRVTGRTNKLVEKGFVKKVGKKPGKSGRMAIVWGIIHHA